MKTVPIVSSEEAETARVMESKLLALPKASGILFAGVSVKPAEGESPAVFRVWVGCDRSFDERTMEPLVLITLRDEIKLGFRVSVEAHRGEVRGRLKSI